MPTDPADVRKGCPQPRGPGGRRANRQGRALQARACECQIAPRADRPCGCAPGLHPAARSRWSEGRLPGLRIPRGAVSVPREHLMPPND